MPNSKKHERRITLPRKRVLLSGKIVFDNGARSMDCLIRDQTKAGCRVRLSSAEAIPSRLHLIDVKRAAAMECQVIWARPAELGLRYLTEYDLQKASEEPLIRSLRRIWLELTVR